MAARLEVEILDQSPDRGNLTPKRQVRWPGAPGWKVDDCETADVLRGTDHGVAPESLGACKGKCIGGLPRGGVQWKL